MKLSTALVLAVLLAAPLTGCSQQTTSGDPIVTPAAGPVETAAIEVTSTPDGGLYAQAAAAFSPDESAQPFEVWRPAWLPDGFEVIDSELSASFFRVEYGRGEDRVSVAQGWGDYGDEGVLDTKPAKWGTKDAVLVLNDTYHFDAEPGVDERECLSVRFESDPITEVQSLGLAEDELLRVAESMQIVD